MTDFEERLRRMLLDVTDRAPAAADRARVLHRRIARRRRIRVAGIAGAVVVVLGGTSAGLVTLRPSAHSVPGVAPTATAAAVPSHVALTGPRNILLVGQDPVSTGSMGRPDTILILHLAADHRTGYLIAIPRDTYVSIPAYDNGAKAYAGGKDKISAAYVYGAQGLTGAAARQHGFELLSKTVTALSGITIDAAAIADFAGFEQVIDAIGGIDLYVDEKTTSIHVGHDKAGKEAVPFEIGTDGMPLKAVPGVKPMVYNVGEQHLTGWQAMDYIRQRDLLANGDGDYGRQRHQEQLLMAVYSKVLSTETLTNPQRLTALLGTIGKALTIDAGPGAVTDWLYSVRDLPADRLVGVAMNGGHFDEALEPGIGDVEQLNATSRQLLDAVRGDSLGQFVAAHPDWVIGTR